MVGLAKVFVAALCGVEGITFTALGIVAHRLDLWLDWQDGLAPAALLAGAVVVAFTLLRTGPAALRLGRAGEEVPGVGAGALASRIGAAGMFALAPARRDGPVEDANRP